MNQYDRVFALVDVLELEAAKLPTTVHDTELNELLIDLKNVVLKIEATKPLTISDIEAMSPDTRPEVWAPAKAKLNALDDMVKAVRDEYEAIERGDRS